MLQMLHVANGTGDMCLHICQELFDCNKTSTKANWHFKCKTVLSNIMGTIMKTVCFSRLRQIITHAAVGASADACDKNIIQVRFSSHHCVPGAISGTVFIGMCAVFVVFPRCRNSS